MPRTMGNLPPFLRTKISSNVTSAFNPEVKCRPLSLSTSLTALPQKNWPIVRSSLANRARCRTSLSSGLLQAPKGEHTDAGRLRVRVEPRVQGSTIESQRRTATIVSEPAGRKMLTCESTAFRCSPCPGHHVTLRPLSSLVFRRLRPASRFVSMPSASNRRGTRLRRPSQGRPFAPPATSSRRSRRRGRASGWPATPTASPASHNGTEP